MTDPTSRTALRAIAPDRRSFLRYTGALGAAAAVTSTLSACSAGPESTNETGGGGQGGDSTLTAVIGYGNDQLGPAADRVRLLDGRHRAHLRGVARHRPDHPRAVRGARHRAPGRPDGDHLKFALRDGRHLARRAAGHRRRRRLHLRPHADPKTQNLAKGFFASWLKDVRKIDATSVELILKFPFPDGAAALSLAKIMPKHVFSKPGAWDDATKGKAVGSGPYRQTAHHPKSNTTFEAFDDYNGPRKAAFKKMNWLTIVDAAPRVAKISGGSADAEIADNIPYANIEQLKRGGLTVEGGAGMNNLFLLFNTAHPPFDDVRVRQALHYAIDAREDDRRSPCKGHGKAATSFLNEANPAYRPAKTGLRIRPGEGEEAPEGGRGQQS